MNTNYYKKQMNVYKYSTSNSVHQEIEEIRRFQKEHQRKTTTKKTSNFLQKLSSKKKRNYVNNYSEVEFLGI